MTKKTRGQITYGIGFKCPILTHAVIMLGYYDSIAPHQITINIMVAAKTNSINETHFREFF